MSTRRKSRFSATSATDSPVHARMRTFPPFRVLILLSLVSAFSACSGYQLADSQAVASAAAAPSGAAESTRLQLAYDRPAVVGSSVRASAKGLPPGKMVDLSWGTVNGGWVVE